MRLKLQVLTGFALLGSTLMATAVTFFQLPMESAFAQQPRDPLSLCMRDLMRIGIDEYNSELVCEEHPIRIRPGGRNISGTYPKGGGCNISGCWLPGGGCNISGCWPPGGSSNISGTTTTGVCTISGCPAEVPDDLFNVEDKL